MWNVGAILTGLLSFMVSEEVAAGSTVASDATRKNYAQVSHAYNLRHFEWYETLFPEKALASKQAIEKHLQHGQSSEQHSEGTTATTTTLSIPVRIAWLVQLAAIVTAFFAFFYALVYRKR